jgi:hypothetical protein
VKAVGERTYLVRFDDGTEKECPSAVLRVEKSHTSLPPDVQLPAAEVEHRVVEEEVQEGIIDQEEDEPLTGENPDSEDEEEGNNLDGDDPPPGMPGQIPTDKEIPKDYTAIKRQALEKISKLVGEEVIIKTRNNGSMTWKVIGSHEPPDVIPEMEHRDYGLKGFKLEHFKKSEVACLIFLRLLFKDWKEKVAKMNEAVASTKVKCRAFTEKEFLTGLGILIGAAEFAKRGSDLFSVKDQQEGDDDEENEVWQSLCAEPHFERFMPFGRWKEFRRFFPEIFVDNNKKDTDPWFQFSSAVDEFNEIRKNEISGSLWISVDESMCAWRPRKTATGGLPNISFIVRKPEPLGKL